MSWWGWRIGGVGHAWQVARDRTTSRMRNGTIPIMKAAKLAPVAAVAIAIGLAAPAHADVDTDFNNQINTYGIYGPHDYNPYLAKIACRRLGDGVDPDAAASANFLSHNLPRGTTQVQTYQFLGTAVSFYCPDLSPKLQNIPAS